MEFKEYNSCILCPRKCRVNRNDGKIGFCRQTAIPMAARASLHFWEEPCISGKKGSGTVFFSGCQLRCCYCQNYELSLGRSGIAVSEEELSLIYLRLQNDGAHNINLVTAEHFAPHIRESILLAKKKGLTIPVILNTSGYVGEEAFEILKDVIDIYLVDFKYMDSLLSKKYSMAEDYPIVAKKALDKMVEAQPEALFDSDGIMKKGVIIRHLCLPSHTDDSKRVIDYVYKKYKKKVLLSIMSQYTPVNTEKLPSNINRKLKESEYDDIINFCFDLGIDDAFIQEGEAASESFIPVFDGFGIKIL